MATRISLGGDFTAAASWALVDATSLLDSEAGSKALTNAYVESSAFTPGAIVITGIAVKISVHSGTTGTISVRLAQGGATVAGTEVTINAGDLDTCTAAQNEGGWYLLTFAAVTLAGATAYTVSCKMSTGGSGATLWTDGTSGNWSRMLRTTTTGAPAATDILHALGEHTGAGTGNNISITQDLNVNTDFGAGTDNVAAMTVGKRGTLTWKTSASTYLKLSGDLIVYSGGTFTRGTVDPTLTSILEFDPVADGGNALLCRNGSIVHDDNIQKVGYYLLNADANINATSITTDSAPVGWRDNDEIVLASTTRTPAQTEKGTLNGAPAGVTFNIDGFAGVGGGLANAHNGVAPTQGEVVNITRNVKIRSATSTIMAYVRISPTAVVTFTGVEFYYIGENATGKRGIEIETTTGSCSITYCAVHDTEDMGIYINTATGGVTISNNVLYACNTVGAASNYPLSCVATSGVHTISTNVLVGCTAAAYICYFIDVGSSYTNNRIVGNTASVSVYYNESAIAGTFSGNLTHSNSSYGFSVTCTGGSISAITAWRCGNYGISLFGQGITTLSIDTLVAFGNATGNIDVGSSSAIGGFVVINNATVNSEAATYTTATGMRVSSGSRVVVSGSSFGATSAHTSRDILVNNANTWVFCYNTTLAATAETTISYFGGAVYSQKHDASATTFKRFGYYGTILSETTIRHAASGYAWKMTPNSATYKMLMPGPTFLESWQSAVVANQTVTISVWLYKDGTYNGNQPRLVVVGGYINGIAADITQSMTGGASSWEQVTINTALPTENGVIMFYVDCDGTLGNVYVDDVSVAQTGLPSSNNLDYPIWGLPMQGIYAAGAGAVSISPMRGGL